MRLSRVLRRIALPAALALAPAAVTVAAPATPPAPRASPSPSDIEALSRQRTLSIGGWLGEPLAGVTVKMLTSHELHDAWEMGFGWSEAAADGWDFHGQRQWHLRELHKSRDGSLSFYLGLGGRVKHAEGTHLGVRGAAGLNWVFPSAPRRYEAFFEVAPIVDVAPDVHTFVNAEIGFRWFLPFPIR